MSNLTSVIAQDAPIGVLLWPVTAPEFEPNFTLEFVEVVRSAHGSFVVWVYENGNRRTFRVGESVAVQLPPAKCSRCDGTGTIENCSYAIGMHEVRCPGPDDSGLCDDGIIRAQLMDAR